METETMGTYLELHTVDDNTWILDEQDAMQIDQAVADHRYSGRDSVMHLTTIEGGSLRVCASAVMGWAVSTPEGRRRWVELRAAMDAEHKENRQRAGCWEDD